MQKIAVFILVAEKYVCLSFHIITYLESLLKYCMRFRRSLSLQR